MTLNGEPLDSVNTGAERFDIYGFNCEEISGAKQLTFARAAVPQSGRVVRPEFVYRVRFPPTRP